MARHATVPAPSDVGERVKRTVLQVFVPAVLFLVLVLPDGIRILDEEIGEHLPPGFRLWMLAAAGVLTGLAATFTRLMAIPRVNDWFSRWTPFGTAPPAEAKAIRAADDELS